MQAVHSLECKGAALWACHLVATVTPRRLSGWSLTPSVQTLLYASPNSTESGPELTKTNQVATIIHPFLRLNQCKRFLIEFPDVQYKINTKNQLQKHKGCKRHKARGVEVHSSRSCHAVLLSPHPARGHFGGGKTNPLVLPDVCGAFFNRVN